MFRWLRRRICISMRPAGPDVSIASVSDQNFAPAALTRY